MNLICLNRPPPEPGCKRHLRRATPLHRSAHSKTAMAHAGGKAGLRGRQGPLIYPRISGWGFGIGGAGQVYGWRELRAPSQSRPTKDGRDTACTSIGRTTLFEGLIDTTPKAAES